MKNRKFKILCFLLTLTFFITILSGCVKNPPVDPVDSEQEIVLSFDGSSAYFTSFVKLAPIKTDLPEAGDKYEQAQIILLSDPKSKFELVIKYKEKASSIPGLKIAVFDTVYDFEDNKVIYSAAEEMTRAELNVKIYLGKDTTPEVSNRSIEFYFELHC